MSDPLTFLIFLVTIIGMILLWALSAVAVLAIPVLIVYWIVQKFRHADALPAHKNESTVPKKKLSDRLGVVLAIGSFALWAFYVGALILPEQPFLVQTLVGGVAISAAFIAFGVTWNLLFNKSTRGHILRIIRQLRRVAPKYEFWVARKASGRVGADYTSPDLEIWQSHANRIPIDEINEVLKQTEAEFTQLTRLDIVPTKRPRILIFHDLDAFEMFNVHFYGQSGFKGWFVHWPRPTIAMSIHPCEAAIRSWRDILAHEYTHLLLWSATKKTVPPWLNEGLACTIASRLQQYPHIDIRVRHSHRAICYGLANDEFFDWKEMNRTQYGAIGGKPDPTVEIDVPHMIRRGRFYQQSERLITYLHQTSPDQLAGFLNAVKIAAKKNQPNPSDYFKTPLEEMCHACLQPSPPMLSEEITPAPSVQEVIDSCRTTLAKSEALSDQVCIQTIGLIASLSGPTEIEHLEPFANHEHPVIAEYTQRLLMTLRFDPNNTSATEPPNQLAVPVTQNR